MTHNEQAALCIGRDELERRLRRSVYCLKTELRPLFRRARFSFANACITSACGKHRLQFIPSADKPQGIVAYVT